MRPESFELSNFQSLCMRHVETAKDTLLKKWFPEVQNIFYQGNKSKQITLTHLDAFFNSVSVLMTSQLRSLCMDSIGDYQELFCPPKVRTASQMKSL